MQPGQYLEEETSGVLPKLFNSGSSISILYPGSHSLAWRRLHTLAWLFSLLPSLASGVPDWEATRLFHLSSKPLPPKASRVDRGSPLLDRRILRISKHLSTSVLPSGWGLQRF